MDSGKLIDNIMKLDGTLEEEIQMRKEWLEKYGHLVPDDEIEEDDENED